MSRVIGGAAGGRRLATPPGRGTRPTSDRVREALFSSLESLPGGLQGVAFLDLYAGSGAVGLEAASRGAGAVTLVERDPSAVKVIRRNLAAVPASTRVEVVASTVERFLAGTPAPYQTVFLDPPYAEPVDRVLAVLAVSGWLARDAVVCVERATRDGAIVWPEGLVGLRSRKYGDTTLWYGRAS
ncbi:MAG TPA: 16S rRNA (guanine(966)-N(2))-methyltransferase RsmD [Mycobacteriales bacterium]|nr:16S rRNA (guanine(966)-N(2))-methyltransferase RsmD [Mycobacteriales bacterium]